MSKVDRATAEESLKRKGFDRDKSGDHIFYYHKYEGKESGIKTWVSHSPKYKDIAMDNVKKMQKELKLDSLDQAKDLLNCPMSKAQYNVILQEKGFLDPGD